MAMPEKDRCEKPCGLKTPVHVSAYLGFGEP